MKPRLFSFREREHLFFFFADADRITGLQSKPARLTGRKVVRTSRRRVGCRRAAKPILPRLRVFVDSPLSTLHAYCPLPTHSSKFPTNVTRVTK